MYDYYFGEEKRCYLQTGGLGKLSYLFLLVPPILVRASLWRTQNICSSHLLSITVALFSL